MEKEPQNLDISKLENVEKPKKAPKNRTCSLIMDVELEMSAILGEVDISLKKVLDLTKGSIIKLDNKTTEPVKLWRTDKKSQAEKLSSLRTTLELESHMWKTTRFHNDKGKINGKKQYNRS